MPAYLDLSQGMASALLLRLLRGLPLLKRFGAFLEQLFFPLLLLKPPEDGLRATVWAAIMHEAPKRRRWYTLGPVGKLLTQPA